MRKNPKFSVIVPVYNVEKYLSYCLETIRMQTLKDIEIICVNDGSVDHSLHILQSYQEDDDRIRVIDKKNGGLSSARNAGLDAAKGEYILFVDSDDYLCVSACDRIYNEFLQTNADIVVFGTATFPWHIASGNIWLNNKLHVITKYYSQNTIMSLFYEPSANPFVWNKCYSRRFIEEYGFRFDEELLYGEDTPFLFDTFPAAREISFIEDKLYNYRCRSEGSLMSHARENPKWKLEMHLKMVEKILLYWQEKSYLSLAMDELYLWVLEFFVYDLENDAITKQDRKEIADRLVNMIEGYGLCFRKKEKAKYGKTIEKRLIAITK